ncbi:deaminase [Phenylobacterium sp.]|uniref:deaminase n=1 Tax=Phenylobacterium sp. TaxID=1871053 RepID=UPI002FD9D972
MSDHDALMMGRAIALAQARLGQTGDNPSVGCVIAKDGVILAEATTAPGGRPHAEEQALAAAGQAARGAQAYVTLEPCGERSTGAASCGQRLVEAGVAEVVIACADPSPYADGRGVERLRQAGVAVRLGIMAAQAARLYAAYTPKARSGPSSEGAA